MKNEKTLSVKPTAIIQPHPSVTPTAISQYPPDISLSIADTDGIERTGPGSLTTERIQCEFHLLADISLVAYLKHLVSSIYIRVMALDLHRFGVVNIIVSLIQQPVKHIQAQTCPNTVCPNILPPRLISGCMVFRLFIYIRNRIFHRDAIVHDT